MSIPAKIYRYLDSFAALKTIEAGKFRVGLLSKFNDPFEWRLGITGAETQTEQEVAKRIIGDHQGWLESWMGIMCFSDSIAEPVLWSLYAEKHHGVAFEVEYDWNSEAENLFPITYSNERPVLDFGRLRSIRDSEARDKYLLNLLDKLRKQKSTGFSFEREYRLSIDLENQQCCQFIEGNHYWKLPNNSLKRVILGFRCPLQENDLRKLLDKNGFENTVLARAAMCSKTYSIMC